MVNDVWHASKRKFVKPTSDAVSKRVLSNSRSSAVIRKITRYFAKKNIRARFLKLSACSIATKRHNSVTGWWSKRQELRGIDPLLSQRRENSKRVLISFFRFLLFTIVVALAALAVSDWHECFFVLAPIEITFLLFEKWATTVWIPLLKKQTS